MEDFILQSYEELQRQADRERWTVATAEFSPAQLQAIFKRLRYAAIRVENRNDRISIEVRNMTSNSYRNRWLRYRNHGYRLTDFDVYEYRGGYRYADV